MTKTVKQIASFIGGKIVGDDQIPIKGITNIEAPVRDFITFAQDEKGLKKLEKTDVACLIVPPNLVSQTKTVIQCEQPKLAWAKLLTEFHPPKKHTAGISPLASVAKTAKIGNNITIGPFVTIADDAEIQDGSVLISQIYIGEKVKIGKNTLLHPGVTIYEDCEIGHNVIIHAGTVIGADGFGYVPTPQGHIKVPQTGNVIIEDDVELGACVTIDCATVGSTRIGRGTKIDNLVQIAHNVIIGPHTVISAQTGISGSSKIGAFVTMGGKVGLGDHVEIGDATIIGAGAGFPSGKKVPGKQIVFGQPARPYDEARKQIAAQLRSAETLEEVRTLKKKVAELEKKLSGAVSH